MLAGDVATIELEAAPGAAVDGVTLLVPRISHAVVNGSELLSPLAPIARATGIGTAGACNVDLACVVPTNAAAIELAKSVAKLTFVGDNGRAFLCSGTLLNDSIAIEHAVSVHRRPLPHVARAIAARSTRTGSTRPIRATARRRRRSCT